MKKQNSQIVFTAKSEMKADLEKEKSRSGLTISQIMRRIVDEHYHDRVNIPESLLMVMDAIKTASSIEDKDTRLSIQKSLNSIFYLLGGNDNENF